MMDEMAKKRAVQIWLRVLYLTLWSLGLLAALAAATWLLVLWRHAAFAAMGLVAGAYLARRGETLIDEITHAFMAVGGGLFAAWLAVTVARNPILLIPYALSVGTFVLYGASVFSTIRVVEAIAGQPIKVSATGAGEPVVQAFEAATLEAASTTEAAPEREPEPEQEQEQEKAAAG